MCVGAHVGASVVTERVIVSVSVSRVSPNLSFYSRGSPPLPLALPQQHDCFRPSAKLVHTILDAISGDRLEEARYIRKQKF